ncbi:MAG: type ISP restriction/modification enzyme [Pseudanabaena sp. ELA645]
MDLRGDVRQDSMRDGVPLGEEHTVFGLYRPFSKKFLYYDPVLNDRPGLFREIFPDTDSINENQVIAVTNHSQIPFRAS